MKKRHFFGLCLLLLLAGACTHHYYFKPSVTQPGQTEAVYTRGAPGLRSQQFGADVTAGLSARGEKDLSLQLYIYNDSDSTYTIQPDAVRVTGYDAFGVPQPLRVFEASEYVRWKRNQDILIGTVIVVATVALILIIDEIADDGRPSGNTGRPDWTYDYYYNPLDWIDFSVNTAIIIGSATAPPPPPQAHPAISENGLLRKHTLYPGEAVQGIVKVRGKANFMQKILVEVPVNGAYHKFVFEHRQPAR